MRRTWWTGLLMGAAASVAVFALTERIHAQNAAVSPTGRVACVNVVQVFNDYQRQKDLTEEMEELKAKLQAEDKQRKQKLDATEAELSKLNPDDPTYVERTRSLLAMQIDYKNWVDLKQADLTREVGLWSVRIYKEIVRATEAIARKEGYDLALYKGEFETVSMNPDDIKQQIRSLQVLYANPTVDISQQVGDKLNADYRAQPRVKMMYVP